MSNVNQTTVRDFEADRKICEAASAGPWVWVPGKREYRDNGSIQSESEGDVCDFGNYTQYYPIAGNEPYETDITFITEARTGWPAALDRIAELEAENERLQTRVQKLSGYNEFNTQYITDLSAENERYRQALESIAEYPGEDCFDSGPLRSRYEELREIAKEAVVGG
jgi:hypothetical protein